MSEESKYNPAIHHRHSIRLKEYDYSSAGGYFITICIQHKDNLLRACEMKINEAGEMTERWFHELESKFPDIKCDEFVCMPNHIHFIIFNVGANLCVRPEDVKPKGVNQIIPQNNISVKNESGDVIVPDGMLYRPSLGEHLGEHSLGEHSLGEHSLGEHSLGEHIGSPLRKIIQWYKTMTTNEYIQGVKTLGWQPFNGKLWQRNYYEHIIRDEKDLNRIRIYIKNNPFKKI